MKRIIIWLIMNKFKKYAETVKFWLKRRVQKIKDQTRRHFIEFEISVNVTKTSLLRIGNNSKLNF